MKDPVIENLGDGKYYIGLDRGVSNGILHFSHEISIWVHKDAANLKILSADEINSDGWFTLNPKGIENKYPGITDFIKKELEKYETKTVV